MKPTPEIVVLTEGAAEKCAKTVELDALQRRVSPALADRYGIVGGNPVDLHRVKLAIAVALQQRQCRGIVKGKAEIGEHQLASFRLGQFCQSISQPHVRLLIDTDQIAPYRYRQNQRTRIADVSWTARQPVIMVARFAVEIGAQTAIDGAAHPFTRGNVGCAPHRNDLIEAPREVAQTAHAKRHIMAAIKSDDLSGGSIFSA